MQPFTKLYMACRCRRQRRLWRAVDQAPQGDPPLKHATKKARHTMKTTRALTALLLTLGAGASFAQTAATTVQRDVNQQTRIEQGQQRRAEHQGKPPSWSARNPRSTACRPTR